MEIILFLVVSAWSNISDQVWHFHQVTEAWQHCLVGHFWPQIIYIWPVGFIRAPSDSRAMPAAQVGHIRHQVRYISPIGFIRPSSGSSTVSPSSTGYIRAPSDISDPAKVEPFWIPNQSYPIWVIYIRCSDTSNSNKCVGDRKKPPLPPWFGWPLQQLKNYSSSHFELVLLIPKLLSWFLSTWERIGANTWVSHPLEQEHSVHLHQWFRSCLLLLGTCPLDV
jgi:hypothetical protein